MTQTLIIPVTEFQEEFGDLHTARTLIAFILHFGGEGLLTDKKALRHAERLEKQIDELIAAAQ